MGSLGCAWVPPFLSVGTSKRNDRLERCCRSVRSNIDLVLGCLNWYDQVLRYSKINNASPVSFELALQGTAQTT